MKKINTFIKNGLILTISTLFLRLIAVLFNIFLSNKISSSLLGIFGIILSVFAFF
jgi:O-antigen/teichoic acid export membrane protein